jgi:biopolymer transport protein ExbB
MASGLQAAPPAETVDASLRHQETSIEDIERGRARLHARIKHLQADLKLAVKGIEADQKALQQLSEERNALKAGAAESLRQKEALDSVITDHAHNFLARAEKDPYSAENLARLEKLRTYLAGGHVFSMSDLRALLDMFFEDIQAGSTLTSYEGLVLDRGGSEVTGGVIRLGHVGALHRVGSETGFLSLSPSSRLVMSAVAPYGVRRNIARFFQGDADRVYVDIAGGAAIQQLAQRESFMDQMRSGGILVIPILLVGLVALVLIVERLVFLARVRHNTDDLMTRVTDLVSKGDFNGAFKTTEPHRNRPTGRVLLAGLQHRGETREIIESSLSEAILRETPRLERFLNALKVAAAVAPLLGLLGTVTGMINTFQVITVHGTGDPRLMAGGISEAMVTTQVGLAVAIPVMMVAAFLGSRAHKLAQDMEEKGLALMGTLLRLQHHNGNAG